MSFKCSGSSHNSFSCSCQEIGYGARLSFSDNNLILGAVGFHYYLPNSKFLKKSCEKYYLKWMLIGFVFSIVFCFILLEIFGKFEYISI